MRVGGLNQDITYWAPIGSNQFGVTSHESPIIIQGRWEDRNEEVGTLGGNVYTSRAIVIVDRDLLTDGFLARGDHTAVPDPTLTTAALKIEAFDSVPDLRNVSNTRRAVL
jgi:hypothetical protein